MQMKKFGIGGKIKMSNWSKIEGKLVYESSDIQNEYWNWEELFNHYLKFEVVGDYGFTISNNMTKSDCDYTGDVYLIVTDWCIEIHPRAHFRYNKDERVLSNIKDILYGFFDWCKEVEHLEIRGELKEDTIKCYINEELVE